MIPTYDPWVWDDFAEVWVNVETGEVSYPYDYDEWAEYAYDEAEYQDSLWNSGYYD